MGIALAENVHIFNAWLPGNDGLQSLDAWLENHPVRLIIIDTLSRWQDDFHGSDIWMRDTKRIADLKAIADLLDSTVLIVHHRSKATRDDIHQSVAGTNALQGAADGSLILDKKRSENTARLSILGRDIPEAELAIEFIPEYCTWKALDYDPSEMALNQDQQCILEALREMGGTGKPGQVAARLGKERSSIGHTMAKMASEGVLTSIAYGTYSTIKPIPSVPTVPTSSGLGVETGNTGNTGNSITGGLYENGHEIESLL
jgi:predicted regulator of amino acid metabolism with ACT domain